MPQPPSSRNHQEKLSFGPHQVTSGHSAEHNPLDEATCAKLSQWIDLELERLETRFAKFSTQHSLDQALSLLR
ncbi:MAG: hypothetical protein CMJ62_16550 [Planctomycetaceae bacterium]|mgnify:CR=1 FL=1|jgi:hypothetical protein|nr:hypothetical protein [Planctomycetaceae bacterium]